MTNLVCHCPGYAWPHRRTSGKCIWNPSHEQPFCEECGQICQYEIIKLEPHEKAHSSQPAVVEAVSSKCCQASVVARGNYLSVADA